MFIILEHWYLFTARVALLAQRKSGESAIHKYRMDLLAGPEYVIKKGGSHFQGIHDRFTRDPEFRNRMKIHRDEDLCRRWDAVADEDHTHHLTSQEYSLFKSKWWLHSQVAPYGWHFGALRSDAYSAGTKKVTVDSLCKKCRLKAV